jgi:hypothetical protein
VYQPDGAVTPLRDTHTPFVVAGSDDDSHTHETAAAQDEQVLYDKVQELWLGHVPAKLEY